MIKKKKISSMALVKHISLVEWAIAWILLATLLRRRVYAEDIERHSTLRPFRRNMGQGRHLGPRRAHVDSTNSIIRLYIVNPWLCASARLREHTYTNVRNTYTDSVVKACRKNKERAQKWKRRKRWRRKRRLMLLDEWTGERAIQ